MESGLKKFKMSIWVFNKSAHTETEVVEMGRDRFEEYLGFRIVRT